MSSNLIRHLTALAFTLMSASFYFGGYYSAFHNWWWTVFSSLIIYGLVYKIIDK